MKHLKRIAAFMIAVLMVLSIVSCASDDDKIYDRVYSYLHDKYHGLEFEATGYTQDKEASGKYTVDVTCNTTGVQFEVIMSSLFTTDSYSASYVNNNIKNDLYKILGSAKDLAYVQDIQWSNYYEENGEQYKFRDFSEIMHYRATDIHDIYRVTMADFTDTKEAAECVYMFCNVLNNNGISLDKVTFAFKLNGDSILFTTDTESIENADFEALQQKLLDAKTEPITGNLFYKDPDARIRNVTYFLEESSSPVETEISTNK